jgi:general secretion pathway protein G
MTKMNAGLPIVKFRNRTPLRRRIAKSETGNRPGFTLIELLLVLVILGVLAVVVVPRFTGRSEQARMTAARTDIASLEVALDAFEVDNGRFPTTEEGLAALVQQPSGLQNWQGPYIRRGVPKDPWGNPYIYRFPGQHNRNGFDLYSMGPDGREGGGDDIVNW